MPLGTGAETLQHIPAQPFVLDPGLFFQMTRQNVITPGGAISDPGAGQKFARSLLQAGIVSKLRLVFDGSLVVAGGASTTSDEWPYALLDDFRLSANGQSDLFSCDGVDLHVLRFARYPAYEDGLDVFPGTVGGGNSVANGTYAVTLTWEVPIAMDDTSLVAALYAQSAATNLVVSVQRALNARLFSTIGGTVAITGNWYIQEHLFEIPFDDKGNMVLPDVTKLHGFNSIDTPFTAVGDVRTSLIRSAGQLARMFVTARSSATNRLSALYSAAASRKLDKVTLEYGGNQRPLVFQPAGTLIAINNQHYHQPLPYDRLALDFVRENPPRDAVLMQGLTELAATLTVNAGVTVSAGKVRLSQETLY